MRLSILSQRELSERIKTVKNSSLFFNKLPPSLYFRFGKNKAVAFFTLHLKSVKKGLTMGKAKLISTLVCSAIIAACSTTNIEQREDIPPSYEHLVVDVKPVERVEPSAPLPLKDNLTQKSIPQPEAPKYSDLWLKIRDQLAFEVPEHQKIEARKSWYLQHPYYMKTVSERAKPFLYHIVQQVEARNLPLELALLPLVESDFKIAASSPQGASGLWQLMPRISRHYGLVVNQEYDGRLHLTDSTQAALSYLSYLHRTFNNDWLLAIAAYNSGEGRVIKAISKNKKRGKGTDFWSLDLPAETADYVPKLLALSALLKEKPTHFVWPAIDVKAQTELVDVGKPFSLIEIAKLANVNTPKLTSLNPAFLTDRSAENAPLTVLLPKTNAYRLKQQLARIAVESGAAYKVKKGDSLYQIAKLFNTNIAAIKSLNQLDSNLIKIGQTLAIPNLAPIENHSLTRDYEISPYLKREESTQYELVKREHTVAAGETLWGISMQYDIDFKELANWNQLSTKAILRPGRTLTIWQKQVKAKDIASTQSSESPFPSFIRANKSP